jgi:hypothetical protein
MTTRRTIPLKHWHAWLARALFGQISPRPQRSRTKGEPACEGDLVRASRILVAVIADDCVSFVEGAARQTQRMRDEAQRKTSAGRIWLPSFIGLGATDVALASSTLARSAKGLGVVGAVGGAGLMVASTLDLCRAQSAEEVLDATGDLAWGVQGLSYLTVAPTAARLTAGVGFVGAVVQMSAGMLRISHGVRIRDTQSLKLGTLDLGGGILWAALDVAAWASPLALAGFVVLMVGREAYANKEALRKAWPSRPWLLPRGPLSKVV